MTEHRNTKSLRPEETDGGLRQDDRGLYTEDMAFVRCIVCPMYTVAVAAKVKGSR